MRTGFAFMIPITHVKPCRGGPGAHGSTPAFSGAPFFFFLASFALPVAVGQ